MGCNINIDTSRPRPPARIVRKRGGITFVAEIQDDFRANPKVNLSRACSDTSDSDRPSIPTEPPEKGITSVSAVFAAAEIDLTNFYIEPNKAAKIAGADLAFDYEINFVLPENMVYTRDTNYSVAATLLLDLYSGAAAAYSMRKVRTSYTGSAIRIREDSGDTETDIGFDGNGDVDTAAIASHCGAANGFVVTWYDQSGNGNDATQSTAARQPKVYNGSSTITENGKPTIEWSDGQNYYLTCSFGSALTQPLTSFISARYNGVSAQQEYLIDGGDASNRMALYHELSTDQWVMSSNGTLRSASADTTESLKQFSLVYNGANSTMRLNGSQIASGNAGSNSLSQLVIGNAYPLDAQYNWDSTLSELIVYDSDQSTNVTGIEADISGHWQSNKLLLNSYPGAAAAYSLRKLDNDYTGSAIRIREDSGDTETDIGFDGNGDVDTAAIASHCGAANGYVVTWYDQSGDGRDATQSIKSNQPHIYDGSAVLTQNGKPAIYCGSGNTYLPLPDSTMPSNVNNFSAFVVQKTSTTNGTTVEFCVSSDARWRHTRILSGSEYIAYGNNTAVGSRTPTGAQEIVTGIAGSTQGNMQLFVDGVSQGSTALQSGTPDPGTAEIGSTNPLAYFQEIITWHSDQSTNRTGIESNIDTYYGVTTQRLLDTYSDALVAYSVRKLSQWYTGNCMRIREDSGDTETDIGFDGNGDLDTAAIASHCGSANGYVVTWYDQSGNAQDVTQATAADQPLIYNGTAVILENGKPAIDFDTEMLVTSSNITTAPKTLMTVARSDTPTGTQIGAGYLNAGRIYWPHYAGATYLSWDSYATLTVQPSQDTNQHLFTAFQEAANKIARLDGGSEVTGGGTSNQTPNDPLSIGNLDGFSLYWKGTIQEVIWWPSSLYSDVSAVESDINTYFSIYP